MPIIEIIDLSADDSKLLAAIGRINKRLKENQKEADKIGKNLGGVTNVLSAGLSKATGAANLFASALGKAGGFVKKLSFDLAKTAALLGGSLFLGFKALTSGLDNLESGIKNILQLRALAPMVGRLGKEIQNLVGGLIDMNNISDFIRRGKGIGLSDNQIKKIVQMGAAIGLVSTKVDELRATELILEAVTKGTIDELINVAPALGNIAKAAVEGKKNLTSMGRAALVTKAIIGQFGATMDRTGNVLQSNFAKMLGFIRGIKEESKGLLEILGGLSKSIGGVLLPLGAGIGAFALNPITGSIGAIVGAAMSSILAAVSVKLIQTSAGDGGTGGARLGALKTVGEEMIAALFRAVQTGNADITIPDEVLRTAFGKNFLPAFRLSAQIVASISKALDSFTKGFFRNFDVTIGSLTKTLENLDFGSFDRLGQNMFKLADAMNKHAPNMIDAMLVLGKSMANVLEFISPTKLTPEEKIEQDIRQLPTGGPLSPKEVIEEVGVLGTLKALLTGDRPEELPTQDKLSTTRASDILFDKLVRATIDNAGKLDKVILKLDEGNDVRKDMRNAGATTR